MSNIYSEEDFNYRSTGLATHYVFYERLGDSEVPRHKRLYTSIKNRLEKAHDEAARLSGVSSKLKTMARAERSKEEKLLQTYFPGAKWDPSDPHSFVDAVNTCLNVREVFLRNKALIESTLGQNSVVSFFPTYLEKAFRSDIDRAAARTFNYSSDAALQSSIQQWLERTVLPLAVNLMFSARNESNSIDPALQSAYAQLLPLIDKGGANSYLSLMSRTYKLDEIASALASDLQSSSTAKQKNRTLAAIRKSSSFQKGEAMENLWELISEAINPNGHRAMGRLGAKADSVMTFGVNSQVVDRVLNSKDKVSRERNVKLFEHFSELSDNFVVYTSVKNYTLNEGFKLRGGFSSGEEISVKDFENLMSFSEKNFSTFIGSLLQFGKGSIGEKMSLKKSFENLIAQKVAFFLFDDFKTIGNESKNSIHLMNLNGIIIPLSSILFALTDSIENETDLRNIVNVKINSPKIYFETEKEQREWEKENKKAWNFQRSFALNNTKIKLNFFANFRNLLGVLS